MIVSSEIATPSLSFAWCKKHETVISESPSAGVKSSTVASSAVTTWLNIGLVVQTSASVAPLKPAVYLNNPLVYVPSCEPAVVSFSTASHPSFIVKYTFSIRRNKNVHYLR